MLLKVDSDKDHESKKVLQQLNSFEFVFRCFGFAHIAQTSTQNANSREVKIAWKSSFPCQTRRSHGLRVHKNLPSIEQRDLFVDGFPTHRANFQRGGAFCARPVPTHKGHISRFFQTYGTHVRVFNFPDVRLKGQQRVKRFQIFFIVFGKFCSLGGSCFCGNKKVAIA